MRLIDRRDEANQELDFKRIRRQQTSSPRWHVIIVGVIEKHIARYVFASERNYILLSEEAVIVAAVAFFYQLDQIRCRKTTPISNWEIECCASQTCIGFQTY